MQPAIKYDSFFCTTKTDSNKERIYDFIEFKKAKQFELFQQAHMNHSINNDHLDLKEYQFYFSKGVDCFVKGENLKAIENFNIAATLNPNYKLYLIKGVVWQDINEHREAIKDFGLAIEQNPQKGEAYHNRGISRAKIGEFKSSIKDFFSAINKNNRNLKAYHDLGIAQYLVGEYKEAIETFSEIIDRKIYEEANTFSISREKSKFHAYRGDAYNAVGDYQNANEDYTEAINLDPENDEAYNNQGTVYFELGEHHKAEDSFIKAINLNPELDAAYHNLNELYIEAGGHLAAIDVYIQAADISSLAQKKDFVLESRHRIQDVLEKMESDKSLPAGTKEEAKQLAKEFEFKVEIGKVKAELNVSNKILESINSKFGGSVDLGELTKEPPEWIPDHMAWKSSDYPAELSPIEKITAYLQDYWRGYRVTRAYFQHKGGHGFYKYIRTNGVLDVLPTQEYFQILEIEKYIRSKIES